MPSGTPIRAFIKDLQTRKSEIARKLDLCSADADCRANILPDIQAWDPANPLPATMIDALGLNSKEVEHINQWPTARKSEVRNAALTAINDTRDMEFFWELYDGAASDNPIDGLGGTAKITVTFRSPRGNVERSGPPGVVLKSEINVRI